jgi:DNA-binding beta-propeller fold protein YncE
MTPMVPPTGTCCLPKVWVGMSASNVIDKYLRSSDRRLSVTVLLIVLSVGLVLFGGPCTAFGQAPEPSPVRSIAQITLDDDGRGLSYPAAVFFDHTEEEIYLVNGGSSRVVVYGPDYFPRTSIGTGRGIDAPRGTFVTDSGHIYICQGRNKNNPVQRITILNGAFFLDREIILDDIPEAASFYPRQVAVNRQGLIYLAGESSRGVLVLDRDGVFLRRLEPMDMIADQEAIAAAALQQQEEERRFEEEQRALSADGDEVSTKGRSRGDIPEEFRPRSSSPGGAPRSGAGLGPVRIRSVHIDKAGNLYLVSAETSKIYVYGPDETFLFSFGEKGGTPRKLSQPRSLAIDEKLRLIYVADYMRHTILVFDMTGKYLFEFGGRGGSPGWFNFPADIAINRKGQIIVADMFNKRVQVLELRAEIAYPLFRGGLPKPAPEKSEPEESENDTQGEELISEDQDLSAGDEEEEIVTEEIIDWSPPPPEAGEIQLEDNP